MRGESARTLPIGLALAAASIDHYFWQGPSNADVRRLFERPVAQKIVRALRQSLKISNEESDDLLGTLEGLDPLLGEVLPTVAVAKRFLARPTSTLSRDLLEATVSTGRLDRARPAPSGSFRAVGEDRLRAHAAD